jgi:hypothetical protein
MGRSLCCMPFGVLPGEVANSDLIEQALQLAW